MAGKSPPTDVTQTDETRTRIAQEAIRLFASQGFDGTSVREIAEASGVTKPVVYYHYGSKDQLCVAVIEECYKRFRIYLESVAPSRGTFRERLRDLVQVHFDYFVREESSARMLYAAAFAPQRHTPEVDFEELERPHLEMLGGLIQDGIASGEVRPVQVDKAALLLMGMMNIHLEALVVVGQLPTEHEVEQIVSIFTDGVSAR